MFATHASFKHPLQLDPDSSIWRAVELVMSTPLYVVTLHDTIEECTRTFLLTGSTELKAVAGSEKFGTLQSVHLVLTPPWSPDGNWQVIRVRRIDLQLHPSDGSDAEAITEAVDGTRYGGFPIRPLVGDVGPLRPIAELLIP